MAKTLKEKTASGLFWGAINSGSMQVLNAVIGLFTTRLLSPDDYGVFGMIAIFTAIAGNIQDSGFSTALVNQKEIRHEDYNAVFWFNISVSISMYVILFFCAPLIAEFFHQPLLVPLSRFVFISFLLSALGIAHSAYMFRNLMNKEKAFLSFSALIISGVVGIIMAYNGMKYWSLAWQQVLYIGIVSIGKWFVVKWHPTLPVNFSPIRRMFGFSNKILVTTIVNTISQNFLTFIFGRLFPAKAVGLFYQSNKWNNMASQLVSGTVAQVAQPVLASLNDDAERQLRVFRKMLRFTAFLTFPVMFGLALVAREFLLIAIGEKWVDCIPLLQILCLGGSFIPFQTLYQNLIISRGRSDSYMWCTIAQIALQIVMVFTLWQQGIVWLVVAFSLLMFLWVIVWHFTASRLVGISLLMLVQDIGPYMLIAASVMCATFFVTSFITSLFPLLVFRIVLAALLYYILMKVFGSKMLDECMGYLRHRTA